MKSSFILALKSNQELNQNQSNKNHLSWFQASEKKQ